MVKKVIIKIFVINVKILNRGVAGSPAGRGSEQAKVKLLDASEGNAFSSWNKCRN